MAKPMTVDQIAEILKRHRFAPWKDIAEAIHDALPEGPEWREIHAGYLAGDDRSAVYLVVPGPGDYRVALQRVEPEPTAERCVWPAEARRAMFEHHHKRSTEMPVNPQVNCASCGTAVRLQDAKCWGCGARFSGNRIMVR